MRGYFVTLGEFLSGRERTEEIVERLQALYPESEAGQVSSWRDLIEELRNCDTLRRMHPDCGLILEYELSVGNMAVDLILCGYTEKGVKVALLVECKRWNDEYIRNHEYSEYRGEAGHMLHPQVQVWRHESAFRNYLNIGDGYKVLSKVYVSHASGAGIDNLMSRNPQCESQHISCSNNLDAVLADAQEHIVGGGEELLRELEGAFYKPSCSVIDAVGKILKKKAAYVLTEEQEEVFAETMKALSGEKRIVRIKGAAGSGKTAILLNLYLKLAKMAEEGTVNVRLATGAQNTYMYREIYGQASGIFEFTFSLAKDCKLNENTVVLIDEAQHSQEGLLSQMLVRGCKLVLCYDERQTIMPDNALAELRTFETRTDFVAVTLYNSVRYNGSVVFETNVWNYLSGASDPVEDEKYRFTVCETFEQFQQETGSLAAGGESELAVIGLLSKDASEICNRPDSIFYTKWDEKEERYWMPYVRGRKYDPKKLWVGTWWLPGLDVEYVAVLAGGDVTWTPHGIKLNLRQTKRYNLIIAVAKELGISVPVSKYTGVQAEGILNQLERPEKHALLERFQEECDKYIKNLYYVMMTRGRKGLIVYFDRKE